MVWIIGIILIFFNLTNWQFCFEKTHFSLKKTMIFQKFLLKTQFKKIIGVDCCEEVNFLTNFFFLHFFNVSQMEIINKDI